MTAARVAIVSAILWMALFSTGAHPGTPAENRDTVLRAMSDELDRTMSELQLKDLEKPYFVQYTVLDEDEYAGRATFGALTSWNHTKDRVLHAQVRVGSYELDNSEFLTGRGGTGFNLPVQTVVDDDYGALRHSLWLASDSAYKQSVELLARKSAFLQSKVQDEQIPDFSRENGIQSTKERRKLEIDSAAIQKQLRSWSRLFKDYPEIQNSGVGISLRLTHRYIVNSEGTRILQPTLLVSVSADASVQASDGMQISQSIPFVARSLERLPSSRQIEQSIREMAEEICALRSAPTLDMDYVGPVLLVGSASADFFSRVLAPSLAAQRAPLSERGIQASRSGELLDRMNRPVLPPYFDIYDDPALQTFENKPLVGFYELDDQGVPGRRVSVVEDGLLTGLLMSRRPVKGFLNSNGHGRSGYPGREAARISNLVIKTKQGKSYEDLKKILIGSCRAERLPYGIVIKELSSSGPGIGVPFLAYKVTLNDGREQLIRGVNTTGFAVSSLRHVQAAGNELYVANRLAGITGVETPVSVVAPSVVLEELELKKASGTQQRPVLLTPPPRKASY
jgi:TldD protein